MKLAITQEHYEEYVSRADNANSQSSTSSPSRSAAAILHQLDITVVSTRPRRSAPQYHYLTSSEIELLTRFIIKGQALNGFAISKADLYSQYNIQHTQAAAAAASSAPQYLADDLKKLQTLNLIQAQPNDYFTLNLQRLSNTTSASSTNRIASSLLCNSYESSVSPSLLPDEQKNPDNHVSDSDYSDHETAMATNNGHSAAANSSKKRKSRQSTSATSNSDVTETRRANNRTSAAKARARRKEYVESLELRYKKARTEKIELEEQMEALKRVNQSLLEQIQQFQQSSQLQLPQPPNQHYQAPFTLFANRAEEEEEATAANIPFLTLPQEQNLISDLEFDAFFTGP
jgi:hypothetical protein